MAINDEVKSLELNEFNDDEFDDEFNDLSYNELLNDFHDLYKSYEKHILKNGILKKKISNLSKELEDFSKEKEVILTCDSLKKENASLNAKVFYLTKIIHKFINGKKNFDIMLGGQKYIFDKGGIWYKLFLKTKYLKNYFVKASSSIA